jgi:phage-related protein
VPRIKVVFFRDDDGTVPVLDWLDAIPSKAQDKCFVRIERLEQLGHDLRRPEADFLRDGIYELRIGLQGMNYRILYFFHRDLAVVLAHGLTKERQVPREDVEKALRRKARFEANPKRHTHEE